MDGKQKAMHTNGNHNAVMEDVQQGDVRLLFAEHKENGIEEIGDFGEKIKVAEQKKDLIVVRVAAIDRRTVEGLHEPAGYPGGEHETDAVEAEKE